MKAIRGGTRAVVVALVAALAACGGQKSEPRTVGRGGGNVVATFIGEVDTVAGTMTITPLPDAIPNALTFWANYQNIPIVQDGIPDNAAEGTVEFVGRAYRTVPAGCGTSDRFEADLEVHSGYAATRLDSAYLEILSVSTGFESCMSEPPPDAGIGEQYGLFSYGTIGPGAKVTKTWSFRVGAGTSFTFTGRLIAQPVEATPPTTTASVDAANYSMVLGCSDTGSGCAGTFYTVDGGATQPYTHPVRLSGTHAICRWSEDVAGNAGSPVCSELTVSASAAPAVYDGTNHAPTCSAIASACDTGPTIIAGASTPTARPLNPETQTPNTIDGCGDSTGDTGGAVGEAVDQIRLETLGGGPLMADAMVRLTAHLTAPMPDDYFYAYYTTRLTSPIWLPVPGFASGALVDGSIDPNPVKTVDFALPAGAVAIRAHVGEFTLPSGFACRASSAYYDDNDDLVITPSVDPLASSSPTVALSAPAGSATVSRTVLVTATTTGTAVTQVAFYRMLPSDPDWTLIDIDTTPPWAVSWDTSSNSGETLLKAVATDNAAHTGTSTTVTVNVVDRTAPVVILQTPAASGSYPRSGSITLGAVATDARQIGIVEWFVDGVRVGTSSTWNAGDIFSANWDPTSFAATTHTAWARATDLDGNANVGMSAKVQFTLE